MTDREAKIAALESELQKYRAECESIAAEMQECRKNVRRDALANLRTARSEYNDAETEHEKADDTRDACRAALCGCVIGQRDPVEVHTEVSTDLKTSLKLKKCAERSNRLWPVIAIWAVAVAFAVIGAVFSKPVLWKTLIFALLGIAAALYYGKRVKESRNAEKRRAAILAKYKADDEEDVKACETEFSRLNAIFTEAEERERRTAKHLEACRERLEKLETSTLEVLDFSGGSSEAAELTRLFNERTQLCQSIAMEIEKLKNG